jgi:8-oxo-dGTP pyrophosphatase MutT (NUDIX family)
MGGSVLPATIHKNKLYFLFGKEREMDENPGWSDFGGGTDKGETFFDTAVREAGEEMTGFLGSDSDVEKMLKKHGTFHVDFKADGHSIYRVHIFPMVYDPMLPHYYNNNQRFLQKKLSPKIIKDTKIFEKAQIRWFCVDDLEKMSKEFRTFYQNILALIMAKKGEIEGFIRKSLKKPRRKSAVQRNRSRSRSQRKTRRQS